MSIDTTPNDDQIQTVLDDLGADVDVYQEDVDVGFEFDTRDGMEVTNVTIVKPVIAPSNEPVGEVQKEVMANGDYFRITLQRRPECPACGYVPAQEGDPITLTGRCVKCGQWTCTNCGGNCFSCDQRLCRDHKDGYGMLGEVLCEKHRRDVEREKEAEWKSAFWERHIEEESVLLEHETHREIAFKELDLDAELQREQMVLDAEIKCRQQELAEFEAHSEHIDREKQRELDMQRHELDRTQMMLEESRKATRLALDVEIERQKQDLRDWKTRADQRIADAEQAFTEEMERREQGQEEYEYEMDRRDDRYEFDKEHRLERNEHELEREKHRHKADLDQQKVDIQKKKHEVDKWEKKRRQKLKEFKAVVKAKTGETSSGRQTNEKKPSWQDLVTVTQQLDKMEEARIDID